MSTLLSVAVGALASASTGVALAQNQHMMSDSMMHNGWMGGYGGYWLPILIAVVAGLVVWLVVKKRK